MDQIRMGRFIAELRKEKGITQQALGEKLGVSNKTVSRWENGAYMPDIEMLEPLSRLLDVSVHELLCGRRMNDADFRAAADANLAEVSRETLFSAREKLTYWQKKWLREHIALLAISALLCAGLCVWAWVRRLVPLLGICPLIWLSAWAGLRHRMMRYAEDRTFGETRK